MTPTPSFSRNLLLAALASMVLACQGSPRRETPVVLDWLDGSVVVHKTIGDSLLTGDELVRAWNSGLAGGADDDGIVWTLSQSVRLQFEILERGPRRLVIEAQPPAGEAIETQIELDGARLLVHTWTGRERLSLTLPADSLDSGFHELRLVAASEPDERGLGLYSVGFEGPSEAQSEGFTLWRWSPLRRGSQLELSGRCAEPSTLELLAHGEGGRWARLWSGSFAADEAFDQAVSLDAVAHLGMARLLLRGGGNGLELLRLRQVVPLDGMAERRNVVLLSLDTTRWDALGALREIDAGATDLGLDRSPSPRLDALARRSTLWRQALSPAPVTAPTHASLFLSSPPRAHGLDGNGRALPRASRANLACYLEAWGYHNAGFITLGVLQSDLGFAQGFTYFSDELGDRWSRPAGKLQESFRTWLANEVEHDGRPRFIWLHYSDPHMPYGQPDAGEGVLLSWDGGDTKHLYGTGRARRFDFFGPAGEHRLRFHAPDDGASGREYKLIRFRLSDESIPWSFGAGFHEGDGILLFRSGAEIIVQLAENGPPGVRLEVGVEDVLSDLEQRRRYAQDVGVMDDAIGETLDLLAARGWLDDALVCAVSDHGEDIGLEDGRWGHVEHVGPSLSRVPMFLLDPRHGAKISDAVVGVIDLAPTLCARLGLPPLPAWYGADVFFEFAPRALHLESFPPEAKENWRALVRDPYKLVGRVSAAGTLDGGLSLYDLRRDPLCRVDLLRGARPGAPETKLRQALAEEWTRWVSRADQPAGSEAAIDPRMEERLRALGYLD